MLHTVVQGPGLTRAPPCDAQFRVLHVGGIAATHSSRTRTNHAAPPDCRQPGSAGEPRDSHSAALFLPQRQLSKAHIASYHPCQREVGGERAKGEHKNLWKNTGETSNAAVIVLPPWRQAGRQGTGRGGGIFNEDPFILYACVIYLKTQIMFRL